MKKITVSKAVILRTNPETHQKEVFATQRGYGDWKGWWEIPGGKIESGAAPEDCIVRKIKEELLTEVSAEKTLGGGYDYPTFHITMHCILRSVVSGDLRLLEHDAAKRLPADELILEKMTRPRHLFETSP